jgi:hypothetical protein
MPVNLKNNLGMMLLIIIAAVSYIFSQSHETKKF